MPLYPEAVISAQARHLSNSRAAWGELRDLVTASIHLTL